MPLGTTPDSVMIPSECIGIIKPLSQTAPKAIQAKSPNTKSAEVITAFIYERYADRCSGENRQADCPKNSPAMDDLSGYTLVQPKDGADRIVFVKDEYLDFTPAKFPERGEFVMCEAPKMQRQITIFANGSVIRSSTCTLDVVRFSNSENFGYTPVTGKKWIQEEIRFHAKETGRKNAECALLNGPSPVLQRISPIDAGVILMAFGLEATQDTSFVIRHRPLAKQLREEIKKAQDSK